MFQLLKDSSGFQGIPGLWGLVSDSLGDGTWSNSQTAAYGHTLTHWHTLEEPEEAERGGGAREEKLLANVRKFPRFFGIKYSLKLVCVSLYVTSNSVRYKLDIFSIWCTASMFQNHYWSLRFSVIKLPEIVDLVDMVSLNFERVLWPMKLISLNWMHWVEILLNSGNLGALQCFIALSGQFQGSLIVQGEFRAVSEQLQCSSSVNRTHQSQSNFSAA